MLAIIMAVLGGWLFWDMQRAFKKIAVKGMQSEQHRRNVVRFVVELVALALLVFLIPFVSDLF